MVEDDGRYRYVWVAYRWDVLVCWLEWLGDGERRIVATCLLGDATTEALRAVPLKLIRTAEMRDYPHWPGEILTGWDPMSGEAEVPLPPSWREVGDQWEPILKAQRLARVEAALLEADPGPRRDGETVDEFYQRVARNYRAYAAVDYMPTSTLAERSGVSKGLAGKWVHEARRRGFLPPTTRGRAGT